MSRKPIDPRGWSWYWDTPRRGELSSDDYARLLHLRERIAEGHVNEFTPETRRLQFVRWCVQEGLYGR